MNSRDNAASRWLSFSFSVHDTMCTYQKNETESQMNSSWILYRSSLDGGFPIRADLQQGISAAVGGIFAEILGVETLRWICPALVLPVFFSFGHRWPRLRGRTIGVCRIKRFCIRVAVPQRFFRDQSLLLVCCPVAPQLSGPCRNDRDGPQDPYRHCTTVPNTHFSGPQDWCTIMCRHLVERNTVAWSPGSAAAQLFCMVDSGSGFTKVRRVMKSGAGLVPVVVCGADRPYLIMKLDTGCSLDRCGSALFKLRF